MKSIAIGRNAKFEAASRVFASLLMVSLLLPSVGCGMNAGGGGTPQDDPPDIPPASTFVMDFSDFEDDDGANKSISILNPVTAQLNDPTHWQWSAGHVAVWNVILTVTLVIPVAAYGEAFNHAPTFDINTGKWTWEYEFFAGGVMHTASLQATTAGGNIEWEMFISKAGGFTNVNWYSGVSNLVGTAGTWRLNRDPQDVTPFIDIEWNRDPATGDADIKYTNVVPDGPLNGGFIYFEIRGGDGHDRVYQIYNNVEDNLTDIEWTRLTKDGRVQDPAHFGDTDWHCWDTALLNVTCADEEG